MIERILKLKNDYTDNLNLDFHTGNLGASFAFTTLGSALNIEEVYDFGLEMLSGIIESSNGLDKYQLIFLGSMVSFMERNQYLDINDDFYQRIDDFSRETLHNVTISYSDIRIFLYLYYFANRIDCDNFDKSNIADITQTIVVILCELIMKTDKIRNSQAPIHYVRFLYFTKMMISFFERKGLFSKLNKRLLESVKSSAKYCYENLNGLELEESLYLKWLLDDFPNDENIKMPDSSDGESASRSIQNLFLLSSEDKSFNDYYNDIAQRLTYRNFGLLNSNLGTLLRDGLTHLTNSNDIVFLMQFYENKKYDLSISATSRILF